MTLALAITIVGCSTTPQAEAEKGAGEQPDQPPVATMAGPQLWADNCMRCHNIRDPKSLSDAQWDVVVHHMRLRANLTGADQRQIAEFLKASN
ncbi:cytochrome c [Planctomycetales bacterium ZRK34]|nr:cytochrome c [Planctomycetales bacterium ZRK34]